MFCRNPGFKTVESELLDALVQASAVRPDHIEQPGPKACYICSLLAAETVEMVSVYLLCIFLT